MTGPRPSDIARELWWVLPQQLAGVRKPEPEELPALQGAGIGAIVSVMDDPSNLEAYAEAGLPYQWLPVTGGTAPTLAQLEQLQTFIDQQREAGRAIALHCSSGRRRTGTMLAAYLIRCGWAWEVALATIQQANPAVELRAAQVEFLRSLAASP